MGRPLDDLVADRNNDRQKQQMQPHARERSLGAHEGENEDADKNYDE